MEDAAQLRSSVVEKLNQLSEKRLLEVSEFVDALISSTPNPLPPPDAFLKYAGTWEFEPGELERIMADIEQHRLLDLTEDDHVLLD